MSYTSFQPRKLVCLAHGKLDGKTTFYNVCNRKITTVLIENQAMNTRVVLNDSISRNKYVESPLSPHKKWKYKTLEVEPVTEEFLTKGFTSLCWHTRLFAAELCYSLTNDVTKAYPVTAAGDGVSINFVLVDREFKFFQIGLLLKVLSSRMDGNGSFFVRIFCPMEGGEHIYAPFFIGPFVVTSRVRDMKPLRNISYTQEIQQVPVTSSKQNPVLHRERTPGISQVVRVVRNMDTTMEEVAAGVTTMCENTTGLRNDMHLMRKSFDRMSEVMTELLMQQRQPTPSPSLFGGYNDGYRQEMIPDILDSPPHVGIWPGHLVVDSEEFSPYTTTGRITN